ncbi:hypothetical protein ACP4OV_017481 [Aristida adscensionis]
MAQRTAQATSSEIQLCQAFTRLQSVPLLPRSSCSWQPYGH